MPSAIACHCGVTAFWTAEQLAHSRYSAAPSAGWTSDDTRRNGVPSWGSLSTLEEPQIWQRFTASLVDEGEDLARDSLDIGLGQVLVDRQREDAICLPLGHREVAHLVTQCLGG